MNPIEHHEKYIADAMRRTRTIYVSTGNLTRSGKHRSVSFLIPTMKNGELFIENITKDIAELFPNTKRVTNDRLTLTDDEIPWAIGLARYHWNSWVNWTVI